MLFINISSDKVQIADAQQEQFLDRNGIESTLGKTLVERHKTFPFQDILLLNGPGGFTNLRVGTLTLNLLNSLLASDPQPAIRLFSITKFELYAYLFKQGFLPKEGIIYIGQRDNIRLFDAETKTYEQIKMDAIPKQENLFFDCVCGDAMKTGNSGGFSNVETITTTLGASISNEVKKSKISKAVGIGEDYRGANTPDMLSFHMTNKGLEVQRQNKAILINIADLGIQAQSQVKPEYMIEAVIQ